MPGENIPPLEFEQVPFNHPLFIISISFSYFYNNHFLFNCVYMYSSGTTGAPKCIVHGHGGTLLNHLKEHRLQSNMKQGDILFYYTGKKKKKVRLYLIIIFYFIAVSWMMWNWVMIIFFWLFFYN
jgi:acetoacetyl-CoA synthetase